MTPQLDVHNLSFRFGNCEAVRNISLKVFHGEFVAIVGPSGCGKTTLLNLLSSKAKAQTGTIDKQGKSRMIYQQGSLLPWLTVAENIRLGMREMPDGEAKEYEIASLIQLIRMEGFENHYPHQLSGGMKQRVELARALGGHSDILLMDEPFSALDFLTRAQMRQELSRILAERPRTIVLVTHDIDEAAQLADRIIILTERPAQISTEFTIDVPRPRDPADWAVVDASRRMYQELGVIRKGAGEAEPSALMSKAS